MTRDARDLGLIFYLPNLGGYRDRANLIGHVIRKLGCGVIVTSRLDLDPKQIGIGDIRIAEVESNRRIPGGTALAASRTVSRLLQENRFNVVHDTFGHLLPLFLYRWRHQGVVFVTSLYNLAEWDLRRVLWPRYRWRTLTQFNLRTSFHRSLVQRAVCRAADCVVVQAPGLIGRLVEYLPWVRSKVTWIPNNVVADQQSIDTPSPVKDEDVIKLLFVGGLTTIKGADHLLTLLSLARAREVQVLADVVGGLAPADERYITERIERESLTASISFPGHMDRAGLDRYHATSDWLFHVSSFDGSPRVVLEALARGLPVIGARHPGVTVLDPDESFILFADPYDPHQLLDRLVEFKANSTRYAARAQVGRTYVDKHFSSSAVSQRYVDLYTRLIDEVSK